MAAKKNDKVEIKEQNQMQLIEVGPENLEKIRPHLKKYKAALGKRKAALEIEVQEKQIIIQLIHESGLKRLPDGTIKFHCDGQEINLIPTDEKLKIKDIDDD